MRFAFTYHPLGFIISNLVGVALLMGAAWWAPIPSEVTGMLWNLIPSGWPEAAAFVFLGALCANNFLFVVSAHKVFQSRNYVPLLTSFVILSGLRQWGMGAGQCLTALVVLWVFGLAWRNTGQSLQGAGAFDGGFVAGIFFPVAPASVFAPIVLWIRAITDGLRPAGIFFPFIGLVTALFIWWSAFYITDTSFSFRAWLLDCPACLTQPTRSKRWIIPYAIWVVISLPGFFSYYLTAVSRVRSALLMLWITWLFSIAFWVFWPSAQVFFWSSSLFFVSAVAAIGIMQVRHPFYRDLLLLGGLICLLVAALLDHIFK